MILDSSFLIDILRGKSQKALEKASLLDNSLEKVSTTSISVMELERGACLSDNKDNEKEKISNLLNSLITYKFDNLAAKKAGEIEARLIKKGLKIDLEDVMIASIAIVNNEAILTKNKKHFERIEELKVLTY